MVFDSGKRYAMRLLIMYEYVVHTGFQERGGVFSKFKTKIGNWKRQKVMGVEIWNRGGLKRYWLLFSEDK